MTDQRGQNAFPLQRTASTKADVGFPTNLERRDTNYGRKEARYDIEDEELKGPGRGLISRTNSTRTNQRKVTESKFKPTVPALEPTLMDSDLNMQVEEQAQCGICHLERPFNIEIEEHVEWVGCDFCDGWYHATCAGVNVKDVEGVDYKCTICM
jgi:hypothetical protein